MTPPEKDPVQTALFDELALLSVMNGDKADADALIGAFVADAKDRISAIRDCLGEKDFVSIRKFAVELQSEADLVKSSMLKFAASCVEQMAAINDLDETKRALQDLEKVLKRFELLLKTSFQKQPPQ